MPDLAIWLREKLVEDLAVDCCAGAAATRETPARAVATLLKTTIMNYEYNYSEELKKQKNE